MTTTIPAVELETEEEARAALERLEAQAREWSTKRDALVARLVTAQQGAAAAAVGGKGTARPAAEIGQLRDELAVAEGALALLASQREEARYGVQLATHRAACARYAATREEIVRLKAAVREAWPPIAALTGADVDRCWSDFPRLRELYRKLDRACGYANLLADRLREEDCVYVGLGPEGLDVGA